MNQAVYLSHGFILGTLNLAMLRRSSEYEFIEPSEHLEF